MRRLFFFLFALSLLTFTAGADNDPANSNSANKDKVGDSVVFVTDDPIIEMFDSLINMIAFQKYKPFFDQTEFNTFGFDHDHLPEYNDSIIESRLEYLNSISPFDFVYNDDVKKHINLYAFKRRHTVRKMLGLARLYFPLFEEKLDKYNLPVELKYLAIVESALNPVAVSRAGAVGLWQFMPATGRMYGLDINRSIDERRDPYLATDAACRHFIDLYNRFGDWTLVLASYNAGSGSVGRAIRRTSKGSDYWSVRPNMPRETQNYVPAFIAVAYIMTFHSEYNLFPVKPRFNYFELDTIAVKYNVTLDLIAEKVGVPIDDIKFLNPALKMGKVYGNQNEPWFVVLPRYAVGEYIINEKAISQTTHKNSKSKIAEKENYHRVRKGESLGVIARKYGCKVTQIKQWNGLRSNLIHPGQKLIIHSK